MRDPVGDWSTRIRATVARRNALAPFVQRASGGIASRWNTALRRFPTLAILFDAINAFNQDQMSLLAASLSYYSLLALFPLLLLLLALAPFFISEADAFARVMRVAQDYLPGSDAEVQRVLHQVVDVRGSATVIGLLTLAWSASGVFDVLQRALDRAWRVPQPRAFWMQRAFSVAVIGLLGIFFLVSIFVSSFSETLVFDALGETNLARETVRFTGSVLGLGLAWIAFAILFKTFPHARVEWNFALRGALVAALLWQTAKYFYELYIVYFARFNLIYGSVGAVIGLLLWGYISASVVLFGAELSAAMARKTGRE